MMMIEKLEACAACGEVKRWLYDSQLCCACGYGDSQRGHSCEEVTQEFRLQNDREWREKLEHVKGENAKLRALLDFQGEPVEGALDAVYSQYRDRIADLDEQVAVMVKTAMKLGEQNRDLESTWAVMARACGNWRTWPGEVETDHAHPDWKAAARAIVERDRLRAIALKAFTVVEWVVGEGKLLESPHFDADDLLLEMAAALGVEDSAAARAALAKAQDSVHVRK